MVSSSSSRIISKILSPALRFWLNSQVEEVETLKLNIEGKDGEILKGYVSNVQLFSKAAVYKGLHLDQIEIIATGIRINIGQILRGKPFRLLEPIQVSGQIQIRERDLQKSLSSEVFLGALNELLLLLLENSGILTFANLLSEGDVYWQNITLEMEQFKLEGIWKTKDEQEYEFILLSGIRLSAPSILELFAIDIQGLPSPYQLSLSQLPIDLGENIEFSRFLLSQGQLRAEGKTIISN